MWFTVLITVLIIRSIYTGPIEKYQNCLTTIIDNSLRQGHTHTLIRGIPSERYKERCAMYVPLYVCMHTQRDNGCLHSEWYVCGASGTLWFFTVRTTLASY
jgi:hypothetical protein